MRILCLTSSFPRHRDDIAGRFVLEFCEQLRGCGHEVEVLTWMDEAANGREHGWQPEHIQLRRVRYAPRRLQTLFYGPGTPETLERAPWKALLAPAAMASMAARVGFDVCAARAECQLPKLKVPGLHRLRHEPDLIIGHWLAPGGLLARVLGQRLGVPSLVVGHSGGVHLLERLPHSMACAVARIVTSGPTTVPTQALRAKLGRWVDVSKVHVLPMGFPDTGGCRVEVLGPRRDWLCMGRLVPIKGFDLAMKAFQHAELGPSVCLHVAGEGPERARLEAMAPPNVQFHGVVTGAAKDALLSRCGFMMFPSRTMPGGRHEGLPVSFMEASAHGIIALTADIPGICALLPDPQRQCVRTRSVDTWARAARGLASLSHDARATLAEEARAVVAPLAWSRLSKKWDELVRSCGQ